MTADNIQDAYAPFTETLRAGGFSQPGEGWNASQIGAHISLNNDLLAEAAGRLRGGEDSSYDNSRAVDDAGLLAYAGGLGDLHGLADAVQASAARLASAYESLSTQERARLVQVTIVHEGQVVRDSPMPLGDLIIGNGEYHLAMHYEQLQALQQ